MKTVIVIGIILLFFTPIMLNILIRRAFRDIKEWFQRKRGYTNDAPMYDTVRDEEINIPYLLNLLTEKGYMEKGTGEETTVVDSEVAYAVEFLLSDQLGLPDMLIRHRLMLYYDPHSSIKWYLHTPSKKIILIK